MMPHHEAKCHYKYFRQYPNSIDPDHAGIPDSLIKVHVAVHNKCTCTVSANSVDPDLGIHCLHIANVSSWVDYVGVNCITHSSLLTV